VGPLKTFNSHPEEWFELAQALKINYTHQDFSPLASNADPSEILKMFVESGLQGPLFKEIRDVFLIAEIPLPDGSKKILICRNMTSVYHAEEDFIRQLKIFCQKSKLALGTVVKIWINFSPCSRCSKRLMDFQASIGQRVSFRLVFAYLFMIKRPSQADQSRVSDKTHMENVKGLHQLLLMQSENTLLPFNEQECQNLAQVLGINNFPYPPARKEGDTNFEQDVVDILNNSLTL